MSLKKKSYGFFASFPAGVTKAIEKLNFYVQQFKKFLTPQQVLIKVLADLNPWAPYFRNMNGIGKLSGISLHSFLLYLHL
jgi:hypothetical protein